MDYISIEKNYRYRKEVLDCKTGKDVLNVFSHLKAYYDNNLDLPLTITGWNEQLGIPYTNLESDKAVLNDYLESKIETDLDDTVLELIEYIDEGTRLTDNDKEIKKYLTKVLSSYGDVLKIEKTIKDFVFAPDDFITFRRMLNLDIANGIIVQLRNYAKSLLSKTKETKQPNNGPSFYINNSSSSNAQNSVNIDVSISIEEARNRAEEAGLSQKQLEEINAKISEIDEILKSKESKHKKWAKAGEILKWVAEQSIQVASFMVPLICQLSN